MCNLINILTFSEYTSVSKLTAFNKHRFENPNYLSCSICVMYTYLHFDYNHNTYNSIRAYCHRSGEYR